MVAAGSIVAIRYEGDDDAERYLIGSIEERGDELDDHSPGSPLGAGARSGARPATSVEYEAPGGTLKVEIVLG